VSSFVLASANPDKVNEMRAILGPLGVELLERPSNVADVDETEDSLEGNALLKARALVEATGQAAIADDTGLFVDALDGRPGVQSARYASQRASYRENVEKLLGELEFVAPPRKARFVTVIVVADPGGDWFSVEGVLEGTISTSARGDGGFGYDSVFSPGRDGARTLAEMTPEQKNDVSHRGRALRALAEKLRQ
jgi:XTP/dITP diphosphohydrolase